MAKDLVLFMIGAGAMAYQAFVVPRPDFNWMVMVFGGVIAGVPGALKLLPRWAPLVGPSSESVEQPSPSPSLPP